MGIGAPAYGYAVEGVELVRVEAELEVVALAKELRAAGATLQAVADELNLRGIPTKRGGKWAPVQVKRITERSA